MANVIKHKSSSTQGAVPETADLILGEFAVNTHDGKVFLKKDDGSESIIELGGGAQQVPVGNGSLNVWEYTATDGQTVFSGEDNHGNTLDIEGTFVTVYVNGFNILPGEFSNDANSVTTTEGIDVDLPVVVYNHVLNGPGIATKSTLPSATLDLFNSIVFEVGNKPYICTANSDAPTQDSDCFWVSLT